MPEVHRSIGSPDAWLHSFLSETLTLLSGRWERGELRGRRGCRSQHARLGGSGLHRDAEPTSGSRGEFDDAIPGVANLAPALLGALRRAATDAADDGVELCVTSGWRSPEYQEQLLQEAVSR
jgi:hypothetical protein